MRTYVDGYNCIFAADLDPNLRDAREELIDRLAATGKSLILVFDGQEFSRSHRGSLEIVYTGGQSADNYILDEVERLGRGRVVTSDGRLARAVKAIGGKVIPVEDFLPDR